MALALKPVLVAVGVELALLVLLRRVDTVAEAFLDLCGDGALCFVDVDVVRLAVVDDLTAASRLCSWAPKLASHCDTCVEMVLKLDCNCATSACRVVVVDPEEAPTARG